MSGGFVPSTPVEGFVHAGNVAGLLDYLRPLAGAERARLAPALVRMNQLMREAGWKSPKAGELHWGGRASDGQQRAVAAGLLLCGSAAQVAEAWLDADDVIALARDFRPPCLPGLADTLMAAGSHHIRLVQGLIAAGLVPRPDSEAYTLGLISLPRWHRRGERFEDWFDADPGLAQALMRMFDIEGTADICLSSIDKYNSVENSWSRHLRTLVERGALSRAALLDAALSTLARDWPQYRSGWFSRFHDELAPGIDELRVNAGRYLQLCLSRIPPTVSLALDALATLEAAGALDPKALLAALQPVMASGNKRQLEAALALLDACVRRDPSLASEAKRTACRGLVHEAPALQARIIKRLAQGELDAAVRAELARYLPGIAASNRAALLKLMGDEPSPSPQVPAGAGPAIEVEGRLAPLDERRRLSPPDGLDALVQLIAHVFENDQDLASFELALAGLVAAAPLAPADLSRFGPVLKRAAKVRKPLALALARLLVSVVKGDELGFTVARDARGFSSEVHARLGRRITALIALAGQGRRLPPLSAPTHLGGFIDPAVLIERARCPGAEAALADVGEQVLALLRLAGPFTDGQRDAARSLPDTPFARALRYALGDDVAPGDERAIYCAAARLRHPGADDAVLLQRYGDLGPDGPRAARYTWDVHSKPWDGEPVGWTHTLVVSSAPRAADVGDLLAVARQAPPSAETSWGLSMLPSLAGDDPGLVAYSATLMPGDRQAFFAEGARAIGNNLDWWEARWQDKAYLEPLLDPTAAPGPMGTLLLACALGAKEPGQSALAADALAALYARGDLDLTLLAATLQRLLRTPLVKAARYRKAFDAALRIHPGLAGGLLDLLPASLPVDADPPPKDIAQWLELLHELLVATGASLSPGAKQRLAGMKLGGRGKTLLKQLAAA